jgi:hypothetical protein
VSVVVVAVFVVVIPRRGGDDERTSGGGDGCIPGERWSLLTTGLPTSREMIVPPPLNDTPARSGDEMGRLRAQNELIRIKSLASYLVLTMGGATITGGR